jgi:hypothetical protein
MKRRMMAGFVVLAVMGGVALRLTSHPEKNSVGLHAIRLIQHSEHSDAGPGEALAGIRIRLSPSDFGYEITPTGHDVPQVAVDAR